MTIRTAERKPRIFYGWFVVASVFSITFVGFGSAYTFSAFVGSLQTEFSASRGSVSLVFSIAGFLYFGLGIVSGPLADRWGARRMVILGVLLTGAGLALAGLARTLEEVYLAYGVGIGVGVGCAYVPALGTVQRWFVRRRGFASGLAVSGIGVGTLVMPPLASWLITLAGWRNAYLLLGALAVIVGVGMAWWLVDDPRSRGLLPDGASPPPLSTTAGAVPTPVAGLTLRQAIASRRFISLYAACLVCSFGLFMPFVHLTPYATDHGATPSSAVLLLGAIGVGSTAGRFFLGGVADRIGRQLSLLLTFAGMGLSLGVWAASSSLAGLFAFALTYGVFYGGFVALLPALAADFFGGKHIAAVIGALYTSVAFGTLIGPSIAGYAYDLQHSYLLPIIAAIACDLVAVIIMAFVSKPVPLGRVQGVGLTTGSEK